MPTAIVRNRTGGIFESVTDYSVIRHKIAMIL